MAPCSTGLLLRRPASSNDRVGLATDAEPMAAWVALRKDVASAVNVNQAQFGRMSPTIDNQIDGDMAHSSAAHVHAH